MKVVPLDASHDRAGFTCGVAALDRYLGQQAGQDVRRRVASCFVLVEDGPVPLGYYTLAATSVKLVELPPSLSKGLPRYPVVPATLLGRLAVDCRHRGRRLGEHLLLDAFTRTLRSEIASFAVVVDAKDEEAAAFYRSYDLQPLTADGRKLFIPLTTIARLFAS